MEPATHMLYGAAMSRAGLNRTTALATLTLVISAELPDIDVLWSAFGPVEGFAHHRGFTHTFLGAPLMAAIVTALIYGYYRLRTRRGHTYAQAPRWKWIYLCALIGSLSHILLDFTNNYGVRPFIPFSYRWYSWDIIFIFEPLIFVALLLALIAPWFGGLIAGEVASRRQRLPGRTSAIVALIFIALLWWVRDFEHRRALAMMDARTYAGEDAIKLGAFPRMINPFSWSGVVETRDFFRVMDVDTHSGEVDPQRNARTLPKPAENMYSLAAKGSRYGRAYFDWARFPYTQVELLEPPEGTGAIVRFGDLRFAYLGRTGNPLGIWVQVDAKGNVVRQGSRSHSEGP